MGLSVMGGGVVVAGNDHSAVLLTVAGTVDAAEAAEPDEWTPAEAGQTLETGDRLRTGDRSRATLRLSNLSVLRVSELTTLVLQPPAEPRRASVLDLRSGATYFFNRERPTTRFRTPTAAGAIRGTEFHLAVGPDGATVLTLLDGEVKMSNPYGEVILTGGEQVIVEPGEAPRKTAVIDAINIIQWTLYYPGVLDPDDLAFEEETAEALADSLRAYRYGDPLAALARYPQERAPVSPMEEVYYAALLLSVGNVGEAERRLADLRADDDGRAAALAHALRETVAAVRGEPMERTIPRELTTEWMAGSYTAQARWQLEGALDMARSAWEQSPGFGFAGARVAELEFSFGRTRPALEALESSLAAAPWNAQAVALRGFLLGAENRHWEALRQFDEAIALDGGLANAWLGRGLMRIRLGQRASGREDLQIAAATEPNRSILRSYLGKAFEHESDPARAEKELDLARRIDSNDPTPWLYSALLKHQHNRVNPAVRDLETSQDLNDNRRVYRSRMLLDQDRAVRSSNLAAVYRDAGMTDYSAREASRAVHHDYTNYSAHLFLANSYDALRDPKQINLRYETPWLSEWFIANLLAPVGAGTLSRNVSQQEYSRLFDGDRYGFDAFAEYRSRGDWRLDVSQFGVEGNSSYALDGGFHSQNGYRRNNDFENVFVSAQVKQQLSRSDSIFLQGTYKYHEGGDLLQYYDPDNASPSLRFRDIQEPNFFGGYHREWSPGSHTLVLGGTFDATFKLNNSDEYIPTILRDGGGDIIGFSPRLFEHDVHREFTGYSVEAQQIQQQTDHTWIVGSRFQTGDVASDSFSVSREPTGFPPLFGPASDQQVEAGLDRFSAYGYYLWQIADPVQLTAGVSYDRIRYPVNTDVLPLSGEMEKREKVSPKAGLVWTPAAATTFRAAYTRSIGGLFYDQSVRLEPVQVAGFTQAYRSMIPESVGGVIAGSEFTTYGLGWDQKFGANTYLIVEGELLESEAERTVGVFDTPGGTIPAQPSGTPQQLDFRERSVTVALNRLLGDQWATGARYRVSVAELDDRFTEIPPDVSPLARRDLESILHQVDLFLLWQHPFGWFGQTDAIWRQQSNRGYEPNRPGDDFWQFDAYAGYRFPRRHAEIRLGVLNIFDKDYRLNPLNLHSELPRERTFLASLRVSF